jgi:hypothetical protein
MSSRTLHMGQERRHADDEALCGAQVNENLTWEKPFVTCWKCIHLLMGRPIPPEPKLPEHDKLKAAKSEGRDATQLIGEFLEWLGDREGGALILAERSEHDDELYPFRGRRDSLIADFFGINENALAAEKEALIEYQRAFNKAVEWAEKEGRPYLARP